MSVVRDRIEKAKMNIKKAKIEKNKEETQRKSGEDLKSGVRKVVAGVAVTAMTAGLAPKANASNVNVSLGSSSDKESKNIVMTPQEMADETTFVLTEKDFNEQHGDRKGKERKEEKKKEIRERKEARKEARELEKEIRKKAGFNREYAKILRNIAVAGYDVEYFQQTESEPYGPYFEPQDVLSIATEDRFVDFTWPLSYDEIVKRGEYKKLFSEPVKYVTETVRLGDAYPDGDNVYPAYASYSYIDNTITSYQYNLEGKEEFINLIMKRRNWSRAEADSLAKKICDETNNPELNAIFKAHEEAYYSDHKKGLLIPNLPAYYMNQLECLTRIHATMAMAAFSLEQYEKDGRLSHFTPVNARVDTLDLQKQLLKENDPEKRKKLVGSYIFDRWLSIWNREGSGYSEEIRYNPRGTDYLQRLMPLNGCDVDNKPFRQEYLRRANEMFVDVGYLGDMRDVINPDFELNPQLRYYGDPIIKSLIGNSPNDARAYDRILGLFAVVRDCDADGVRTKEEQDLINKTILDLREKAEQEGKKTQESQESSGQSILLQKQTHER